MTHSYYSQRTGVNPHQDGLPLNEVVGLFARVFTQLQKDGYFDEAFGFYCVDDGQVPGKVADVEVEILLQIRKSNLWPVEVRAAEYSEDDFFDVIEFLYQYVSKPVDGRMHTWKNCGMHWDTFDRTAGQATFRAKVNEILGHYSKRFELSPDGHILHRAEEGLEPIFHAEVPSDEPNVISRVNSAVQRYRRHGSTLDDRRQAVRDLADVLEYLRPQVKELLTSKDEADLFNIANNFGIRHHNDKQKTDYDTALWLSWMFYFYLATIHVLLRKLKSTQE